MTRVAAIDCGTNSIRLLVADADPATGELDDLDRRMTIVRLGQGVDRTGRLAPEALERTLRGAATSTPRVIAEYRRRARPLRGHLASRDAENRDEFVARRAWTSSASSPRSITGDEEAEFSFTGATRELPARADPTPYLVVDIGGGSTEFVAR